jgi:hypothetical protein
MTPCRIHPLHANESVPEIQCEVGIIRCRGVGSPKEPLRERQIAALVGLASLEEGGADLRGAFRWRGEPNRLRAGATAQRETGRHPERCAD